MEPASDDKQGMIRPISIPLPDRLARGGRPIAAAIGNGVNSLRQMYGRTLALWAHDLLASQPEAAWAEADPLDDYTNRDWRLMYTGDVLDD